ncbi:hypothetical protein [Rhodococcus sp. NPDC047139]|uniref:hypothetical protein n=1 Tax=Rhodococcus sp. NPDC047139 TaxID=3155141 RepID=UPI0033EA3019
MTLNQLREKYADIQQSSLDFLRELLELTRDTVAAEKAVHEIPREVQGKAALTELFQALKTEGTPVIVDHIVTRTDEVVRAVRFDGWQATIRGDQEVRRALRQTLYLQFKIRDNDVFEKAFGYLLRAVVFATPGTQPAQCSPFGRRPALIIGPEVSLR